MRLSVLGCGSILQAFCSLVEVESAAIPYGLLRFFMFHHPRISNQYSSFLCLPGILLPICLFFARVWGLCIGEKMS